MGLGDYGRGDEAPTDRPIFRQVPDLVAGVSIFPSEPRPVPLEDQGEVIGMDEFRGLPPYDLFPFPARVL